MKLNGVTKYRAYMSKCFRPFVRIFVTSVTPWVSCPQVVRHSTRRDTLWLTTAVVRKYTLNNFNEHRKFYFKIMKHPVWPHTEMAHAPKRSLQCGFQPQICNGHLSNSIWDKYNNNNTVALKLIVQSTQTTEQNIYSTLTEFVWGAAVGNRPSHSI